MRYTTTDGPNKPLNAIQEGSLGDKMGIAVQSMKSLSNYRNAAIHHTAKCPMIDIGESAFYTAIESSKYLYNHFNEGRWDSSEYKKFVNDNQAKIKTLLRKALDE